MMQAQSDASNQAKVGLNTMKNQNKMAGFIDSLKGKKTYFIVASTILYAVAGAVSGLHDWARATEIILGALGLGALRAGVAKV